MGCYGGFPEGSEVIGLWYVMGDFWLCNLRLEVQRSVRI